jgi:acetate kinase
MPFGQPSCREGSTSLLQRCQHAALFHQKSCQVSLSTTRAGQNVLMQVGVFDTAFHQTMPARAYLYALPYDLHTTHGVRKFGMHGTSYHFLLDALAEEMGRPRGSINAIIAHLGAAAVPESCWFDPPPIDSPSISRISLCIVY